MVCLRLCKICVEVACQQDLGPIFFNPDGSSDVLYDQGIAGGDIAPNNMPPPPTHHQLKPDNVWAVEAELFIRKVLRLAVKNCDVAAVNTLHLRCHHPEAAEFPLVNSFCEICLLKNTIIQLLLLHPANY